MLSSRSARLSAAGGVAGAMTSFPTTWAVRWASQTRRLAFEKDPARIPEPVRADLEGQLKNIEAAKQYLEFLSRPENVQYYIDSSPQVVTMPFPDVSDSDDSPPTTPTASAPSSDARADASSADRAATTTRAPASRNARATANPA